MYSYLSRFQGLLQDPVQLIISFQCIAWQMPYVRRLLSLLLEYCSAAALQRSAQPYFLPDYFFPPLARLRPLHVKIQRVNASLMSLRAPLYLPTRFLFMYTPQNCLKIC